VRIQHYAQFRLFIIDMRYSRETQNPSESNPWGFDSPSRHQISNLFATSCRQGSDRHEFVRYKYGTVRILFIFNSLHGLMHLRLFASVRPVDTCLRSITECAADNRSAQNTFTPRVDCSGVNRLGIGRELAGLPENYSACATH
jgi:hypothetical protein